MAQTSEIQPEPPLSAILLPADRLVAEGLLHSAHLACRGDAGGNVVIPKYIFRGPGDSSSFLRVGIFAGVHGDEPSGTAAAVQLLERLVASPESVRGYELFVYPVCNPWGYLSGSRFLESGADLNREFWKNSPQKEARLIEEELTNTKFDGIISLHSDDTSDGIYGFVKGNELTRFVLEPALEEAGKILPRNLGSNIDNFSACEGIIVEGYSGILSAPPSQHPQPFEIVFETPHCACGEKQIQAHIAAVLTSLEKFRMLISVAQNI